MTLLELATTVRTDARYALRHMRRAPATASLIIVTLSLGIGANTMMVGLVDRLLLRPPPHIGEPDRLARLLFVTGGVQGPHTFGSASNYATLVDLARNVASFQDIAGYSHVRMSVGIGTNAIEGNVTLVSPNFFSTLHVLPALGRWFDVSDGYSTGEAEGGAAYAVLGHGFWQQRYAGDKAVIGRTLRVGSLTYTVVGVAPEGFRGVEPQVPDLWLPAPVTAPIEAPALWYAGRGAAWLTLIGRLAPATSSATAARQATTVWARSRAETRADSAAHIIAASIIPARAPDAPREIRTALWLSVISLAVLLIACANVASLLLARAHQRRREVGIRIALGAGRTRLIAQLVIEASVMVLAAMLAAFAMAAFGSRLLSHLLVVDSDGTATALLDAHLLAFTAAAGLGTVLLVSLAPVLLTTNPSPADVLRQAGPSGRRGSGRFRTTLLAVQSALCMLLLLGAALFTMSLWRIRQLNLGVDTEHTLMARFDIASLGLPRPVQDALYQAMRQRVSGIPGVERVAFAEINPYRNGRAVAAHTLEHDADYFWTGRSGEVPMEAAVDTGFFRTVGAELAGRDFDGTDRPGTQRVVIINEPLAQMLWPNANALGQCLILPKRTDDHSAICYAVIGVLKGFWRRTILNRDLLLVYVPLTQPAVTAGPPKSLFIRFQGDAGTVARSVRNEIQSLRSDLPAIGIDVIADIIAPEIRPWQTATLLLVLFGLIALAIALVGLYGLVSFTAAQRSSEIAVRIALGASTRHILGIVLVEAVMAVAIGIVVGLVISVGTEPLIGSLLFNTRPADASILVSATILMLATASVACAAPTLRVLRLNPASVLQRD